jgi:hypothetical protein
LLDPMPPNSLFISLPDGMVCRHPVRFSSVALLCLVILQGVLYSLLSCCLHAAAIMRKTSPVHPDPGSDVTQLNLRFARRRARINRLPHGLPPCTVLYDGYCDKASCSFCWRIISNLAAEIKAPRLWLNQQHFSAAFSGVYSHYQSTKESKSKGSRYSLTAYAIQDCAAHRSGI